MLFSMGISRDQQSAHSRLSKNGGYPQILLKRWTVMIFTMQLSDALF